MRHFCIVIIALSLLSACSKQPPPTIEEQLLFKVFSNYVGGLTYDEVCNGTDPKSRYDFEKKENVFLQDNQRMLAARLGGLWHIRYPQKSVDEGVKHLLSIQKKIEEKAHSVLKEKGCDSEQATTLAKAYKQFRTQPSLILMPSLDREIVKRGGRVTTVEEVEAAGKDKNK